MWWLFIVLPLLVIFLCLVFLLTILLFLILWLTLVRTLIFLIIFVVKLADVELCRPILHQVLLRKEYLRSDVEASSVLHRILLKKDLKAFDYIAVVDGLIRIDILYVQNLTSFSSSHRSLDHGTHLLLHGVECLTATASTRSLTLRLCL